eukprot:Pgem_evm1s18143
MFLIDEKCLNLKVLNVSACRHIKREDADKCVNVEEVITTSKPYIPTAFPS